MVKDLKKYCAQFKLGSGGRKDDLKNRVRGHWYTARGQNHVHPGVVIAERDDEVVPLSLGVIVAETEEEMIELEEYAEHREDFDSLDSDCDEVVSFEQFSSD